MAKFSVKIERTLVQTATIQVEAEDEDEMMEIVENRASDFSPQWELESDTTEVLDVDEIDKDDG